MWSQPLNELPVGGITDRPAWDFFEQPSGTHNIDRVGVLPWTIGPGGDLLFLVGPAWYDDQPLSDIGGTCEEDPAHGEDPFGCLLREVGEEVGNLDLDLPRRIRDPRTLMLTRYRGFRPPSGYRAQGTGQKHRYSVEFLVYVPYQPDPTRGWNGGERRKNDQRVDPAGPPAVGLGELLDLRWDSLRDWPRVSPGLGQMMPYVRSLISYYPYARSVLDDVRRGPLTWSLLEEYLSLFGDSDHMLDILPRAEHATTRVALKKIEAAMRAAAGLDAAYVLHAV